MAGVMSGTSGSRVINGYGKVLRIPSQDLAFLKVKQETALRFPVCTNSKLGW
jgi:hypothetical protein